MWVRTARLMLAVGLPVIFLGLFFFSVHWGEDGLSFTPKFSWAEFSSAVGGVAWWGWALLILAALAQVLHVALRAARWRIMLDPMKSRIGFYNLFSTVSIGYMVTMLLPGRIGEVLRPVMLARRERISVSGTLATVFLERILDGICILALVVVYLFLSTGPAEEGTRSATDGSAGNWGAVIGGLMILALAVLWAFVHYRTKVAALLEWIYPESRPGGGAIHKIFHGVVDGFAVLKGGKALIGVWAYTFAIWCLIAFSIWFSLLAFEIRIPLTGSFLMQAALAFGIAIPTQGGVGTYEYFGQQALAIFFGVDESRAGAAVLVLHIFAISPTILLGLFFVWKEGLSFRGLTAQAKTVEPAAALASPAESEP